MDSKYSNIFYEGNLELKQLVDLTVSKTEKLRGYAQFHKQVDVGILYNTEQSQ